MAIETTGCLPPILVSLSMEAMIIGFVRLFMKKRAPQIRESLARPVTPAAIEQVLDAGLFRG